MSHSYFIARRLFGNKDAKTVSRSAISIAIGGVAVGIAVMIISLCVVLGFKNEITAKIIGFGSHVQIRNYQSYLGGVQHPIGFTSDYISELNRMQDVSHVQRFTDKEGILKTNDEFKGVLLHGIGQEYDCSFLSENLVEGKLPLFTDSTSTNAVVVSQQIADELKLKVGDRVYAYFFDGSLRTRRFAIAGIYRSNLTEFDNNLIYTDIYTVNKLNNWEKDQYSGAEIIVFDFDRITEISSLLSKKINVDIDVYGNSYCALNIKELYPQIFSWLELLDLNIFVILVLMIAVAGFTMVSGLLIIILERTNFIGVMKAIGATNKQIRNVFIHFSAILLVKGMFWGNILGFGLVVLQRYFGIISLDPTIYYIDKVPIAFNVMHIFLLEMATACICLVAIILPCYIIAHIKPARAIRFE